MKIWMILGKSASGKDTVYERLLKESPLPLTPLVLYTTRPMRKGEQQGITYHFVSQEERKKMEAAGEILEQRVYQTTQGPWYYFTALDDQLKEEKQFLMIGTLEALKKIREVLGKEKVAPLYLELEDGERLSRALDREKKQASPDYGEVCRRFLADQEDFKEETLLQMGITRRYSNEELEPCVQAVIADMSKL